MSPVITNLPGSNPYRSTRYRETIATRRPPPERSTSLTTYVHAMPLLWTPQYTQSPRHPNDPGLSSIHIHTRRASPILIHVLEMRLARNADAIWTRPVRAHVSGDVSRREVYRLQRGMNLHVFRRGQPCGQALRAWPRSKGVR